jgi:serine protease
LAGISQQAWSCHTMNASGRKNITVNTRLFSGMNTLALATALALGTLATTNASAGQVYTDALRTQQSFSQFIVQFKEQSVARTSSASAVSAVSALALQSGRSLTHARRLAVGADVVRVEGKALSAADAEAFMKNLASNPDVEYVQVDALMQPLFVPNDTRYGEQWHYVGGASGMNLPAAWDIATGTGVVVAVIDTGITSHADLSANIVAGYDFIADATAARDGGGRDSNPQDEGDWFAAGECGQPSARNSSWHGSHVAGTIAAVTNNSSGVAGVAFGAKVQPVRVLGKCGGSLSDIADAIVWASGGTVAGIPANPTPAKVINMSLGGSGACDATYQNAINSAVGRGTVVAVAAGNSNSDASGFRPASCNNVINVASLDREGNRASYSNYGAIIDLGAPGGETAVAGNGVLSTLNTGTTTPGSATYAFYQGTSMASPHIAGLAALMLSKSPTLTPAQIESTMKANVRAITGSCTGGCGAGAADAGKTLQALNGGGGGGTSFFQNLTDFAILDNTTINSPIVVSGRTGNAPATLAVAVRILHTYQGDLKVDLVAPDGTLYNIHNRTGAGTDNIIKTVTINASSEVANGTWNLRVNDNANVDTGTLDSWSMQF